MAIHRNLGLGSVTCAPPRRMEVMAADNDAERRTRGRRHEKISRPATATTNFDGGGGGMHYSSPSPNFMSLRARERG